MRKCIFCGEPVRSTRYTAAEIKNSVCCNHCYLRIVQPYERNKAAGIPTKVKLFYMDGEPQMPKGLEGKVTSFDDAGQIHVQWNNGSTLALNAEKDVFILC